MRYLKMISNFVFGTNFNTCRYSTPSKQKLIENMYRPYGYRDW